ncbi:DUF2790 domain-containing protein [Pseudomonas sp. R5(2019)]|uniref:DUF2790 domain-containing protein n=1 Tax=Pseudomonas sp. R5(2019) TaxID=2697566 RepID=UPI0014134E32|nr:DUF2790 domain-containing protein [Pseudomonas sp. R5(2019)]NBA95201.1 DUF2790 domain-containing protein [Pseudomonas sp. R5(2019)]
MKHLRLLLIVSATLLSSTVWAEGSSDRLYGKMIQANEQSMREYASAQGKNSPEVTHYRYGMKLDIAKVIHVTSTNGSCGVMPAQMTYEDSSGNLNILEYRVSGTNCSSEN